MTHVDRSYCESTSQSHRWPKTSGGQLCCGGYGKSLGVGGKMPLISLCGPKKHADYSARSDQRSFCKRPSVALWTPPTAGRDKVSHWEKGLFCVTHEDDDDFILTGTELNLRCFHLVIHFTKDALYLFCWNVCFYVFKDGDIKMTPTNCSWSQSKRLDSSIVDILKRGFERCNTRILQVTSYFRSFCHHFYVDLFEHTKLNAKIWGKNASNRARNYYFITQVIICQEKSQQFSGFSFCSPLFSLPKKFH